MVWSTTQSAQYEAEHRCGRRAPRTENRPDDTPRRHDRGNKRKGLFDDGDTLLLLILLYILAKEKTDQTLTMSLLIALLM